MKHNNVIPNIHFHKDWQLRVKTWFDQPGKKKARRKARAIKAARVFPRPTSGALRPVVHAPTVKYNTKKRLGRGFTLEEIKQAGFPNQLAARAVGIAVDHRRKNRSERSLRDNVQRLSEYKAKLIVFPRNNRKKAKPSDASAEDIAKAQQQSGAIIPFTRPAATTEFRAITEEDRKSKAFFTLRQERANAKYVGVRQVRRKKKEEAKLVGAKGKGKKKK